jgi:hypothetical protein
MSSNDIHHKFDEYGGLVRIEADGQETFIPASNSRPMTDEEITQAALDDPDAQPLHFDRLRTVPRVRTLRRALSLTQ